MLLDLLIGVAGGCGAAIGFVVTMNLVAFLEDRRERSTQRRVAETIRQLAKRLASEAIAAPRGIGTGLSVAAERLHRAADLEDGHAIS